MEFFNEFLSKMENKEQREKMHKLLTWVNKEFPNLEPKIAWNQPMFTSEGTFIIGFSYSKKHIAISPEKFTLDKFREEIENANYDATSMIFRITWDQEINFELLRKMIEFNIVDKRGYTKFWR